MQLKAPYLQKAELLSPGTHLLRHHPQPGVFKHLSQNLF